MTSREEERLNWELAGLVDTESGRLERPLADDEWRVPGTVELDGDRLVWEWGDPAHVRFSRSGNDLLEDFVRLADTPSDAIRDYARKWGVLRICAHGEPMSHNPGGSDSPACLPLGWHPGSGGGWEPLEPWRRYAGRAQAILRAAAALHVDGKVDPGDWVRCFPEDLPLEDPFYAVPKESRLGLAINFWLGTAKPSGLHADWPRDGAPSIVLGLGRAPLFAAIGLQLLFSATRSGGLAVCSNCGTPYFPTRRPRKDQRSYCPGCRKRAGARDAQRDRRQRLRSGTDADRNLTAKPVNECGSSRTEEGENG